MRAFDIHVFQDRDGNVRASVTDSDGRRTRPVVLSVGARLALEHVLSQVKAAHEEATAAK